MSTPNIQLFQACVDEEGESDFRLLVDSKFVKCLTIDGGVFYPDDMCFGPSLVALLPSFPAGNWNKARISRDPATGWAHFSEISRVSLPGIRTVWHPKRVDHLDLNMGENLRSNVYEATGPHFDTTVIVKFARFPAEIPLLEAETTAYEWIQGAQIGPEFLGHLIEQDRVIGFITSRVAEFRHAIPDDLPAYRSTLAKLRALEIKHGDVNKHNFHVQNGEAALIDFDCAETFGIGSSELVRDMEGLRQELEDTPGKGSYDVEDD